jgi:peptide deformylase
MPIPHINRLNGDLPKRQKLLVERDSPVLRAVAETVKPEEIGSKKISSVIEKMKKAVHAEDDGVAIAAPQIGEGLRIFLVKGSAVAIAQGDEPSAKRYPDLVFINPEVIRASRKKSEMEEGCLSLRYLYGKVLRHEKVSVRALDENGDSIEADASGLLAQIFQHEIDHLDGILFIDTAEDIRDLPPENNEQGKD